MRLNWTRLVALLSVLALLAACATSDSGNASPTPKPALTPIPLSQAGHTISQASNHLGFDLLQQLRASTPETNIFLSPISLSLLLQIAYNGADGESAQEMARVLHVDGLEVAAMNEASKEFQDNLRGASDVELLIANSIWTQQGFTLLDSYVENIKEYFNAEAAALDFSSPQSLERINQWVSDGTKGKIPKLFDALEPDSLAYLINTVFFKGTWTNQFNPANTGDMPFHLVDGSEITIPMMSQTETFSTTVQESFAAFSLPYGDGRMRMVIVLPNEGMQLSSVIEQLSAESWQTLLTQLDAEAWNINLSMPRFKMEYDEKLNAAFIALGMQRPFTESDFANMVEGGGLSISYILHKAIVEVNEEGTVAAAVSVGAMATSAPPSYIVDRPFFFAIHDTHTNSILFMGTVYKPEPLGE